tara:strand:+ start:576 stop:926 length:351 start_codon:yes stop_codon:yes gene_type:complete
MMSRITLNTEVKDKLDKEELRSDADKWFAEKVAEGFESTGGIKLGLGESDVTLLTGNFVLAKEADELELDIPPIIDSDGIAHQLTIEQLTGLMLEYGQRRAALSVQYAAKRQGTED